MTPMFPSLFRPLIRDKSSLPLLGVGLGEDSCPKVLDRSRLSPGSGGVEPLTAAAQKKNYLITNYPQPRNDGTNQEHAVVSASLNDGAQQGPVSKGPQ